LKNIRYVCFSDFHFGQETSLFTNNSTDIQNSENPAQAQLQPSPVMVKLFAALKDFINATNSGSGPKPVLILNGDILEFALARTNTAFMVFMRFLQQTMQQGDELFERIILIPGNHDHHIWEVARETQYVENYLPGKTADSLLDVPYHTTRMFHFEKDKTIYPYMLNSIAKIVGLDNKKLRIAYPNYGLYNKEESRCVVFHHGHFIETIYRLLSEAISMIFPDRDFPATVTALEEENFAWIDFFWSTMGRSGKAGEKVSLIYDSLNNKKARDNLIKNLSRGIARDKRLDIPVLPDGLEETLFTTLIKGMVKRVMKSEKGNWEKILSNDAKKGLGNYLRWAIYSQLLTEIGNIPETIQFVFGHTHKPYESWKKKFTFGSDTHRELNLINTGGWVVEKTEPMARHGASMVLFDKSLNSSVFKIYTEDGSKSALVHSPVTSQGGEIFNNSLIEGFKKSQPQWDILEGEIKIQLAEKQKLLKRKLDSQ